MDLIATSVTSASRDAFFVIMVQYVSRYQDEWHINNAISVFILTMLVSAGLIVARQQLNAKFTKPSTRAGGAILQFANFNLVGMLYLVQLVTSSALTIVIMNLIQREQNIEHVLVPLIIIVELIILVYIYQ